MFFKKAVLVIHGFGSGTWANEYLVNYLNYDYKLDAYAITLPGHQKDYIRKVKYQDWITACQQEVKKLLKEYQELYLVGHSMGGVIATYLATQYPEVKKLVLLAPAFDYINLDQNKDDIAATLKARKHQKKPELENYSELTSRLFTIAPSTFYQFYKLIKTYKKYVEKVKCETLIIYGEYDELVPYKSVEYAYQAIQAKHKYITKVKKARHGILMGSQKEKVSSYIKIFLRGGLRWEKGKQLEI